MSAGKIEPSLLLLLATILPIVAVVGSRLHSQRPLWLRVVSDACVLLALTFLLQQTLGSPLDPQFNTTHTGEQLWQQLVEAGWWIMAARLAVGGVRALIVLEHRPRESQIVSDLLAGAIYVATFLAIINFAFTVPIRGLLATSGVIAIVLGLALQSTLSDVFSGIAVGIEKPYSVGDFLWVEGGIEGRVLQVNWRSTQIATADGNVAVIPNSVVAKARLINRSAPTPARGQTMVFKLDAGIPPERCIAAMKAAMRACRVPQTTPAPSITCVGLHGDGAIYEVSFSVATSVELSDAATEIATLVHRHLRFDGIGLATAGVASLGHVQPPGAAQTLEHSDLFGMIEASERNVLADHLTPIWLQPGEILLRQADRSTALFIIASGVAEITRTDVGETRIVTYMSPGECVGAIGFITDSPYGATATAVTPLKAYRLERTDLCAAIKKRPELASALEVLAQQGLSALRRDAAAHQDAPLIQREAFQPRLLHFLRLIRA